MPPVIDPAAALLAFAALSLGVAALWWPRSGIIARVQRILRLTERVRTEDAVKYLYHAGSDGSAVRAEALAGALALRPARARELLTTLVARGLVTTVGVGFALTEPGRRDALRLVRAHRLLERYLADHTGVAPTEWHELAEDAEHDLTADEAEALAARLGNPRFDPHGDPIPTADGELPSAPVILLDDLRLHEPGTIVHIEDEPPEAFATLQQVGVVLGGTVVVRARDPQQVEMEIDGRPLRLPRLLESAVSVRRSVAIPTGAVRTLASLQPAESARVARVALACSGAQRRRLLDLGVVPGTRITAVLRSAGGDPVAYDVRGALIALRRQQAEWIEVVADAAQANERSA